MGNDTERTPQPPVAGIRRRRLSFVWLVPVLALLGVGWYAWREATRERGPLITISFTNADGLEPGAEIRSRGVTVGVVRTVALGRGMETVEVVAELTPLSAGLAVEGTRFWIVRPEVSLSRVAGLETLLGPRYIGVGPGAGGVRTDSFVGLARPPVLEDPGDAGALVIELLAPRAAGIGPGAPVLFRDMPVGFVRTVRLAEDSSGVKIVVAIDPSYAILVRENSRFWVASGVGVDWGLFSGLSVRADSLDALIEGAVAFATPTKPGDRVSRGHGFVLAAEPQSKWLEWDPSIPLRGETDGIGED